VHCPSLHLQYHLWPAVTTGESHARPTRSSSRWSLQTWTLAALAISYNFLTIIHWIPHPAQYYPTTKTSKHHPDCFLPSWLHHWKWSLPTLALTHAPPLIHHNSCATLNHTHSIVSPYIPSVSHYPPALWVPPSPWSHRVNKVKDNTISRFLFYFMAYLWSIWPWQLNTVIGPYSHVQLLQPHVQMYMQQHSIPM